jgi:D-alanyl-lipoteichoic acid acyltransferase DltB (MBOAT superfamily)
MPSMLGGGPISDAERSANNARNQPWVVALALLAFLLLGYLFAGFHRFLPVWSPRRLFSWLPAEIFAGGSFRPRLVVSLTERYAPEFEIQFLLCQLAAAFICVYFAPLRWKRPLIVCWFLVTIGILFGPAVTLGLLAAHLFIYLVFHPRGPGARWIAGLAVALAGALLVGGDWHDPGRAAGVLFAAGFAGFAAVRVHERWAVPLLMRPGPGRVIRLVATHLPFVSVTLGTCLGGLLGTRLVAPLALVLFFWHYMRLLMYGVDVQDGLVPEKLPVLTYLSVFFSPATIDSWAYGVSTAQGYSYQTDRFLSQDKNRLVLKGLGLFALAAGYMAFGDLLVGGVVLLADRLGVVAYANLVFMLKRHLLTHDVATSTVLVTSLLDHLQWILLMGGLYHFNVGMWRLFGYDIDPYMHFPLLATNMVSLWGRLTYHFKEVLVRAFYYPVFLRLSRWPLWARTVVATMVAAGLANWLWVHLTETLLFAGLSGSSVVRALRMWPYFLLLGGGISVAQLWVNWRGRRRKPWSFDRRILLDVLAAYVTAQFYAMIHVFYYSYYITAGTVWDHWVIFLRGLGLA